MPVAVRKAYFVECIFAELHEAEIEAVIGHRACVLREVLLHERDGGRVEIAVVQADVQLTVADDGVFVRPHVTDFEFDEAKRFVEVQRLENLGRSHREFEEAAQRAHFSAPSSIAR